MYVLTRSGASVPPGRARGLGGVLLLTMTGWQREGAQCVCGGGSSMTQHWAQCQDGREKGGDQAWASETSQRQAGRRPENTPPSQRPTEGAPSLPLGTATPGAAGPTLGRASRHLCVPSTCPAHLLTAPQQSPLRTHGHVLWSRPEVSPGRALPGCQPAALVAWCPLQNQALA